jgi:plasmid stabilization system protein ParE
LARAVRWAGRARSDFRRAVEYVRGNSPASAAKFLTRVLDAARSLDELSDRGRVVPELDDPDVHEVFVGKYRILYEVREDGVWVMRVIHGSQDLLLALGRRDYEEDDTED